MTAAGWDLAGDALWLALTTFTALDMALRLWAVAGRPSQARQSAPARRWTAGRVASAAGAWRWVVGHARGVRLAVARALSKVFSATDWPAGSVALLVVASVGARGATGGWAQSVAPGLDLVAFFVTGGISVVAVARAGLKRAEVSATNLGRRQTVERRNSGGHARGVRLAVARARSKVFSATDWQAGSVALLVVASVAARGVMGGWAQSVAPSLELVAFFVTGGMSVFAVVRVVLKRSQVHATGLGRRQTVERRNSCGHA